MDVNDLILEVRVRAWVYSGVELEIELAGLHHENNRLSSDDLGKEYNNKRMDKIKSELYLVNERISSLKKLNA